MNSIEITERLNSELVNYLTTTFDVNKNGDEEELAYKIRESFERPGALFRGPFLELILPYKMGLSINQLIEKGVLSPKLTQLQSFKLEDPEPIPLDAKLYRHQEIAIRKLSSEKKSIVISSGTGSGKTEGFLIPIINDLLEDDTPGVRAILIYPLNALVNDQLDRLRILLKGTDITFGRYTGELPNEANRSEETLPNEIISRSEIRDQKRVPQILITNYAMLEYLLLRPEDSLIFESGKWRFLVLDEAHTYAGAQGIEVSMLMRRLKQRLGDRASEMQCVATSATLVNNDADAAVDFAEKLFDAQINKDDIIFGEVNQQYFEKNIEAHGDIHYETYVHEKFQDLLVELRKDEKDYSSILLHLIEIGICKEDILANVPKNEAEMPEFLYGELSKNAELVRLRNWMIERQRPVEVTEAAEYMFPKLDKPKSNDALYHLIELGAHIRPGIRKLPVLPAKYHLFVRPPQGVWVCINPLCPGKDENSTSQWSYLYSTPHETCDKCGAKVYPIGMCRQCGQTFIIMQERENIYEPVDGQILENARKRYFTWKLIHENQSLGIEDEEQNVEEVEDVTQSNEGFILCLSCGKEKKLCNCENPIKSIPLYCIEKKEVRRKGGVEITQLIPVDEIRKCPRCLTKSKKGTEVVTPVTASGETTLSNLAYELYRQLPPSTKKEISSKPGEGRKLLTFYDSRQGAARFAAFLQDSCNKQNYRHLVPEATSQLIKENGYSPALDGLSNKCMDLAWQYRIIQNDPDSSFWRTNAKRFNHEEREKNKTILKAQILGEFTTGSRSRQSLEQMGFVGIDYFEEDYLPDFALLANKLHLNNEKTRALVSYFLDEVRFQKYVKLPSGIYPDDINFGGNSGNARLIRQGNPNYGEVRWIGETANQRRRQYLQLVNSRNRLDSSDAAVIKGLGDIWEWLIDETDVLLGSPENGFQLNSDRLFFTTNLHWYRCNKCLRLFYRGNSLPCPFPDCGGDLQSIDINFLQKNNYFYNLFKKELIPVRVEEHTAQIDPEKGREYQDNFKKGNINILSCSTTFEMGIDLGDLQTVLLSNVPPTVANYRQRAGRAGRRTSETAFILTWASNRPHDQAYYDDPIEIISGNVAVPKIAIENEIILRRHTNAILFSSFMRYLNNNGCENLAQCGSFFDYDVLDKPHFSHIKKWSEDNKLIIGNLLKTYADLVKWNQNEIIQDGLQNFLIDITKLNDVDYQPIVNYYNQRIEELGESSKDPSLTRDAAEKIINQQEYFRKLREKMRNEKLIDFLSNKAVLPSYSFPLHTVELLLPITIRQNEHLRLQRDIRQAIKEYAPGSEIVADKRIWKSLRPFFLKDTAGKTEYYICKNCQNLLISEAPGLPINTDNGNCPVCGEPVRKSKKFVEPDGFISDPKSGKPAKQFVNVEPNQMRSALLPMKTIEEEQLGELIYLAYERNGQLLYVNEGKQGRGFKLSLDKFNLYSEETSGNTENFSLGHIQITDTLHIRFNPTGSVIIPSPLDESFWLSLMYAIIHAASHKLQIERRDIDGVLSPRKLGDTWEQTIVLYDNVPGGAGHVKNIHHHLIEILQEAERVLNCDDCGIDTSCYHCLKDYNNQYFHEFLRRKDALKFVELLMGRISPVKSDIPNAFRVVSPNSAIWLLRKLENTRSSLDLALEEITVGHPWGDNYLWLDNLSDLMNKGCQINLYLKNLPEANAQGLSISKYLQVLINKGLKLWLIKELPKVQLIIDSESGLDSRAIWSENEKSIKLANDLGCENLLTTISSEGIEKSLLLLKSISSEPIVAEQLYAPANVKVINIQAQRQGKISEEELFGELFQKPIKSITVNDPYLFTYEQIVNRLGTYIAMAMKHTTLEKISIYTRSAQPNNEQMSAEKKIITLYGEKVVFNHTIPEHDRYLIIQQESGEKIRILIGRGLDFIQPDGSVKSTYIVIEDPWKG